LAESDGLWHFAASTAMHGRIVDAAVWRANDAGTHAVLEMLGSVDAPGPLFHISTAFVCGLRTGRVLEADVPAGDFRNSYEASKAAAERRVRAAFASGLTGCIFRPSVVLEDTPRPASANMIDLVATAALAGERAGEPLILRLPRDASLNVVHGDWLLAALSAVAAAGAVDGQTYHLTARKPLLLLEVAGELAGPGANHSIVLDPAVKSRNLPPVSRVLDRALVPFKPYLSANVRFDRTRFEAAAPALARLPECDPVVVLRLRRQLDPRPSPCPVTLAGET
jgi:nucleoside-diphosphate-sugar epimerase